MRHTLLVLVVSTLLFACVPPVQSLTPARFEIVELWITPYGYDAGSVRVTKIFTDQQYWFGATIRKYGEESASVVYSWNLDDLPGHAEDSGQVQSGEILEFPIAILLDGHAPILGGAAVLLWPGITHKFRFTIDWESASGGTGKVSNSMDFTVENPPVTKTTTSPTAEATFTGVSTAFPGWTTAQTIVNVSSPTPTEMILTVAVLVLGALVVILLIRRGGQKGP